MDNCLYRVLKICVKIEDIVSSDTRKNGEDKVYLQ